MTLDEIKVLIDELVWAAKESQAYIDDQFVATDEEGAELFKKERESQDKLWEAIIEYGRESAAEVFTMGERNNRVSRKEHGE